MTSREKPQPEAQSAREQIGNIPVEDFIRQYEVSNPEVQGALRKYPSLSYLLGWVEYAGERREVPWDQQERDVYVVRDGSGMFGLTEEDDAMRWRGIFNHMVGSARNVYNLTAMLKGLTEEQRQALENEGYDFSEYDRLDAESLASFMYGPSHCTRRVVDEKRIYNIDDEAHPQGTPGQTALAFLKREKAPEIFQRLIEVETKAEELLDREKRPDGKVNIVDAILTYADWTYTQQPISLPDGFADKKASPRFEKHLNLLEELKGYGERFERDVEVVLGMSACGLFDYLCTAKISDFEHDIRAAYCAPSGLSPLSPEVFREYAQRMSGG